jgi:hypothetical protein
VKNPVSHLERFGDFTIPDPFFVETSDLPCVTPSVGLLLFRLGYSSTCNDTVRAFSGGVYEWIIKIPTSTLFATVM